MIDEFRRLAQVLQKQILIRLAGSGVGMVMVTLLLICNADWRLVVPGLALAIVSLFSAMLLFAMCAISSLPCSATPSASSRLCLRSSCSIPSMP